MTQGTNDQVGEVFSATARDAARNSDSDSDRAPDAETGVGDWKRAHADLVRLAALRASLDWDEGRSLLAALRFGSHLKLGFGSFIEYIERLFGYRPRFTQEKLRVAEALEELPELDRALRDGELSWSAVRELTRVATLNTENPGSQPRAGEPCATSRSWCPGENRATDPVTPLHLKRSAIRSGSKSRRKCWRPFGTPWPNSGAIPAASSMMTRRCCSWPARCSAGRRIRVERAIKFRSRCASAAGRRTSTAAVSGSRSGRRCWRWPSATRSGLGKPMWAQGRRPGPVMQQRRRRRNRSSGAHAGHAVHPAGRAAESVRTRRSKVQRPRVSSLAVPRSAPHQASRRGRRSRAGKAHHPLRGSSSRRPRGCARRYR